MVERNAGVAPDKRIEFRIGIHLGDVVEESDGDLMGDGVNIAARLEGVCRAGRDLPFRGRLSSGEGPARSRGHRSRPDPTQEHRRADPGLFAASWRPRPGEARLRRRPAAPKKRSSLARLAAGIAALIVVAGGAWWLLEANRPAAVATKSPALVASNVTTPAEARHLSSGCAAVRQPLKRPEPGLFRRWHHGELDHRPLAPRRRFRDRAQHRLHLQGQEMSTPRRSARNSSVRYVLEGSVQRDPSRLRVNVQLIDADTGNHLWADRFDKPAG